MLALIPHFIPVADEVYRLQTGSDPECRLFQQIAEQGHYAGRTRPSGSRQGTYAATPSGVLLASLNSNDPERILAMLQEGLAKWETLSRAERLLSDDPEALPGERWRGERLYPADGLVLRVNSRDLPREVAGADWTASAWNQDYAWFTKAEARQLLPARPEPDLRYEIPPTLVSRIARCCLVDNVRGQTRPWAEEEIERARLAAEVAAVEGDIVKLQLEGEMHAAAEGVWSVRGLRDREEPTPQQRGMTVRLLGHARYDLRRERFLTFDLVALGSCWGATQFNVRGDDMGPAPIGWVFSLAGDSLAERVAPAFLRAYGWRD